MEMVRRADMRGYLIEDDRPIAYIKKRRLLGGFRWSPVNAVIITDRTFRLSRLRLG